MGDASVEICAGQWRINVNGPAEFIKEILQEYAPALALGGIAPPADAGLRHGPVTSKTMPAKVSQNQNIEYENVFDFADEKLKIISNIEGKNNAERTRKTCLTLLFGKSLLGEDVIQSEELRNACADQGCYDSNNFAQYLKSLGNLVVMNTKTGGGYTVKLTAPGRKTAKDMVEQLNGEG
jgi:hypothetical protein